MAVFLVDRVRREACGDGRHQHIKGVCTYSGGVYYPRAQVVQSITNGNEWYTHVGGGARGARIRPISRCPRCTATPYITTRPDDEIDNNLESLPECLP